MTGFTHSFACVARACANRLRRFRRNKRGNIAIMFGLLAPVLIGGMGMAMESAYWYVDQRGMQNAADTAALAAATDGSTNYQTTVNAVVAQYGYVNGANGATVASINNAACPGSAATNCYRVSITSKQVLYLLPVVGFRGDTTIDGGSPAQTLTASSTAKVATTPRNYCILALNTLGTALQTNGAPKADLSGCNTMSNSSADCNGHNLGADYGDAHINDSGCGIVQTSNLPVVPDPYAGLASNIPANTCAGSYPQEPGKHGGTALPSSNLWTGSKSLSGNVQICGDLELTGDVTINAPTGAVLVIENGQLDTNGYTIRTASGSAVTVVFSGTSGSYTHAPTGGGTLDIQAPKTGVWSGVALYQDPSLTTGMDISDAGNSPTWDITGLVYLPNANVTFSGAVNKSANGDSCFVLVVSDITINGTASILSHGGCAAAGLNMPLNQIPGRGQLVF
jgi:Flp pilus assembly protein TadG